MKKSGSLPRTALGRSIKILSGGASILAKEVGERVKTAVSGVADADGALATRMRQAQQLVDTLGDLKGAAMKAGQMLSMEASDFLPPEVVNVLRQLHDAAPPMAFSEVERILRQELGEARFAQLTELSREPIASASIGQVHSAFIGGEKVAIKIQYPGVATSIDSDLAVLRKLAGGLLTLQGKSIDLEEVFAEIARGLKTEVDYQAEAVSLLAYRDAFAGDERYCVPRLYPDFSTKHVLTLEFIDALKMKDWLRAEVTDEERAVFAAAIVDILVKEFYEAGLVQTDPNYGNFLYRPDKRQVVLLDFGATHSFDRPFRRDYRRLLQAADTGTDAEILERAERLFHLDPREKPEVKTLFVLLMRTSIRAFQEDWQPMEFNDAAFIEELRELTLRFLKAVEFTPPPKQLLFLNRKLGGMFHLLKDAGCSIDLHEFWLKVQALDI